MSSNRQILEEVLSKTKELQKMIMFMKVLKFVAMQTFVV